jgi:predicted Zn-ribbon and HTH transcriptional regulator
MEDEFQGEDETTRQRLSRWLEEAEYDFEALRLALELPARELEAELRHVGRSARRAGRRLVVEPPLCRECGFDFPGRAERHLHSPSRCPRCRSRRIAPPRFEIPG